MTDQSVDQRVTAIEEAQARTVAENVDLKAQLAEAKESIHFLVRDVLRFGEDIEDRKNREQELTRELAWLGTQGDMLADAGRAATDRQRVLGRAVVALGGLLAILGAGDMPLSGDLAEAQRAHTATLRKVGALKP